MENKNYSTLRVVLIFLAIASVVLAVMHIVKLTGSTADDPQTDLSGYGSENEDYDPDEIYYEDNSTVEMDSIPNGALTSGSDVSGADVSEADAE